jgi:hypothetical protein
MRIVALLVLLSLLGCRTSGAEGGPPETEPGTTPKDPHERFLDYATVVKADEIQAILPADIEPEVEVSGLSTGWREDNGRKVWEGSGDARVKIRELLLAGPSVTVTLVSSQAVREIVVQATGDVSFAHAAPGGTEWMGKDLLMIRNDRWLER